MKTRLLLFASILFFAVGCSVFQTAFSPSADALERSDSDDVVPYAPEPSSDRELRDEGASVEKVYTESTSSDGMAYGGDVAESEVMMFEAVDADVAVGGFAPSTAPEAQQASVLKAGEIDDNAEWDDYLLYRRESLDSFGDWVHDVDVSRRQIITVLDTDGLPILGAMVTIVTDDQIVSRTHTYANGQTLFFPNANASNQDVDEFSVTIEKGNQSQTYDMNLLRGGPSWEFTLDAQSSRDTVKLDVMFLLDATGSMSDEISQLQNNLLSISEQIDAMGDVDVRYGLVHYRDRDDDYITRVHDFTPDVKAFQKDLNSVRADGGGDTPESLNAGLHDALQSVEWRGDDTIKLVFLVADAPPHLDYPDDYDYAVEMLYAAEKGIKVHPIASSGLDAVGEYIFRQIGQTTMGRFIFLTYAGGVPGEAGDERPDLEASEQDYTVDFLDGLVVRLVEEEINAFKGLTEQ